MVSCSDKLLRSGDAHVELVLALRIEPKEKEKKNMKRSVKRTKQSSVRASLLLFGYRELPFGRVSCLILFARGNSRGVSRAAATLSLENVNEL